ncbi:uncharacterized protein B0T15DRAFT_282983 [Chaetomium strumarium]|uniref:Uncharacterized protein n=1 Tax=Chaetomium strumarium TaxID=1170767 RepID=A0AAJ0GPJ4_9PEZI|nr:hypothetical protein B0T15DRAFT_282983 [Chaetomium strumarium]
MGHSSKFVFPLPGRKQKHAPIPQISSPLTTKAHKILGTSALNIDSAASAIWETQSNSGISVAVSETTNGQLELGPTHDGRAAFGTLRDKHWEQESEIIPVVLNRQSDFPGSMVPDGATDASSLRRRQSSSTITSYYDKSKLPLSISQQTSNSAMAKGLPPKAQALLDYDASFVDPSQSQTQKARKKPSRLDLSSLLHMHRTPKHLHQDTSSNNNTNNTNNTNNQLLGHDMFTKSPSVMSMSPLVTPSPVPQRPDRDIRRKTTRESLREGVAQRPDSERQQQQSKDTADLYNLYDHYEQRTFADAMDRELKGGGYQVEPPSRPPSYPPPVPGQSGKGLLSPFPAPSSRAARSVKQSPLVTTTEKRKSTGSATPSSPVPADTASVSSRHTRTSKASKRTDRSLQEIDLLQNSVLALSSDSEDDYELSSKSSLVVPTSSDGQSSPTSPRFSTRQPAATGVYHGSRDKPMKRTSFAPSPKPSPGSQEFEAVKGPRISPRSSSLNAKKSVKAALPALSQDMSRLSIGTASTGRTVSHVGSRGSDPANSERKAVKKMRSEAQFDFPAPPGQRGQRAASVSRISDQSLVLSPTTVDMYLQSQRSLAPPENGSIRSSTSLGSAVNASRRDSTASSLHDGNSGRFMAVSRQEEMLLAALRMKRARMREEIIAEFEEDIEKEEHQLRREVTNDSVTTAGSVSRESSRCTMRLETGTLSAVPRPRHQAKEKAVPSRAPSDQASHESSRNTPVSGMVDFIDYDDLLVSPIGSLKRQDSKASSISSRKSASTRQRASLSAMPAPPPSRVQRRDGGSSRTGSVQTSPNGQTDLPHRILEDPAEDDEDEDGIPRPDSPISPSDFPAPVSSGIKNKKQVRLSAVGFYKPNFEAGW